MRDRGSFAVQKSPFRRCDRSVRITTATLPGVRTLDGDQAVQLGIAGLVNHTHAVLSQRVENLVLPNSGCHAALPVTACVAISVLQWPYGSYRVRRSPSVRGYERRSGNQFRELGVYPST